MIACRQAVLFVNIHKRNSSALSLQIKDELCKRGIETFIFSFEGKPDNPPTGEWDIAFSLGGDGTVLYTARCLASSGVPILPLNLGSLGFISNVDKEAWLDVFELWQNGGLSPSRRYMLEFYVERDSKTIAANTCLNDIVVSASGLAKLIRLNVFFEETTLGSYRCDGLIAATPTGSTAYSMAAGGPILDPEMEAVIINPICPFALSNRPLVLPSKQTITIAVADEQRTGVMLTADGQYMLNLECGDKIHIKQSPKPALLIFSDRHAYYSALRNKLFWSGDNGGCGA